MFNDEMADSENQRVNDEMADTEPNKITGKGNNGEQTLVYDERTLKVNVFNKQILKWLNE